MSSSKNENGQDEITDEAFQNYKKDLLGKLVGANGFNCIPKRIIINVDQKEKTVTIQCTKTKLATQELFEELYEKNNEQIYLVETPQSLESKHCIILQWSFRNTFQERLNNPVRFKLKKPVGYSLYANIQPFPSMQQPTETPITREKRLKDTAAQIASENISLSEKIKKAEEKGALFFLAELMREENNYIEAIICYNLVLPTYSRFADACAEAGNLCLLLSEQHQLDKIQYFLLHKKLPPEDFANMGLDTDSKFAQHNQDEFSRERLKLAITLKRRNETPTKLEQNVINRLYDGFIGNPGLGEVKDISKPETLLTIGNELYHTKEKLKNTEAQLAESTEEIQKLKDKLAEFERSQHESTGTNSFFKTKT